MKGIKTEKTRILKGIHELMRKNAHYFIKL
jgi:hypothetical protein